MAKPRSIDRRAKRCIDRIATIFATYRTNRLLTYHNLLSYLTVLREEKSIQQVTH